MTRKDKKRLERECRAYARAILLHPVFNDKNKSGKRDVIANALMDMWHEGRTSLKAQIRNLLDGKQ